MKRKRMIAALLAASLLSVPRLDAAAMEAEEVEEIAEEIGADYGICPELLQAIAYQESRYQADASAGGCEGLMQVAEKWHTDRMERLGVTDLYEPKGNMLVAADYLAELFGTYGDAGMVLMVYNGDSQAQEYWETGYGMSDYAADILERSEQLEREHGK